MFRTILRMMGNRPTWAIPYILFMVLLVVVPLFLVGYYALVDENGFTWRYFEKFFLQPDARCLFRYRHGLHADALDLRHL